MAGLPATCPHCGQQTDLLLALPPEEPTIPRRAVLWTLIGIVVLCLGLVGALAALKRAQNLAARQKQRTEAAALPLDTTRGQVQDAKAAEGEVDQNGFIASPISLEQEPGTSRISATGTIRNRTERKRFGVKVEIDLLDEAGTKLGTATDYQAAIEPGDEWRFRALVMESKASSARLGAIREDQ
jgi:hypothetical protein